MMKTAAGTIFGILGVVLLVFAGVVGKDSSTIAQEGTDGLRVMTYNIKHGQGNDDCADPTVPEGDLPTVQCAVDLERAADVIREADPDIVALQEIDRFWARSGAVDQPAELAELLDMEACFGANLEHPTDEHAADEHEYGTLILSKFPILGCENTDLPTPEDWEQRGLLEARVDVDGVGEIAVLNTHLQADRTDEEEEAVRQRTEQAEAVADRVKELDVPVVLMGDFNANPDDEELTSLLDPEIALQDAWAVGGDGTDGFTSPAELEGDPENRIDFVFVSQDFTVDNAEVVVDDSTREASDHYPVVVDLTLSLDATPVASPEAPVFATPIT